MSKLYGFKYTVESGVHNYTQYSILSERDNRYYIDKLYKGAIYHFDITDKIDDFCKALEALGIDKWNMNDYQSSIDWFPPADYWTLEIHTDSVSVACKGQWSRPPEWKYFVDLLNQMGDIISE